MIRGKIISTLAEIGKLIRVTFKGRDDEDVKDRISIQQYGFKSVPRKGDQCLALVDNGFILVVGSEALKEITISEGDTIIYSDKDNYIKILGNGGIEIECNGKIKINSGEVEIGGTATSELVKKTLLTVLESHVHPPNAVSPQLVGLSGSHYTTKLKSE
jgi:phage gp45-like